MGKSLKLDLGLAIVGSRFSCMVALQPVAPDLVVSCWLSSVHSSGEGSDVVRLQSLG